LGSITPGSWISANFNVWIGAPEDNKAWDYLYAAREFYEQNAASATEEQRKLAYEEILIAEGSDWNWWYGPEHHSANDRDFDELYRKHLANVYHALGAMPPDYLVQPITASAGRPAFIAQANFIRQGSTARSPATLSGWARPCTPRTCGREPCTANSISWTRSMPEWMSTFYTAAWIRRRRARHEL